MESHLDLATERTLLASIRTFLASIRTNSIFAGLVMILLSMKYYTPCILILTCCILIQVSISYLYFYIDKQESYKYKSDSGHKLYNLHPLMYSILLIFILLVMLVICIKLRFKINK